MKSKNLHVGDRERTKSLWFPVVGWALLIFALSSVPGHKVPSSPFFSADKVVHVLVYAVLGALAARALFRGSSLGRRGCMWLGAAAAALYGVSDEVHQLFVPHRFAGVGDVVADAVGALLGAWAALRKA